MLAQAEEWAQEAARLEEKLTDQATRSRASQMAGHTRELPKIEFQLGVVVQNMQRNSKKSLHEQLMEWDKVGTGEISKSDFKMRLREIGLHASTDEVEVLFARFDEDGSGFVDVEELTNGMNHLRKLMAAQAHTERENALLRQKVQALQAREADARDAVASQEKAEACQRELYEMRNALEGRVDIKLGDLLVKRCIKVETIIGTWPKARSRENMAHAREISKAEWKDEIVALGLVVADADGKPCPVERSQLGALFDEVDADKSGWMDLREAKDALKKWQQLSKESNAAIEAKEKELARLRRRAATKLQGALRDGSSPGALRASDPYGSPGSPGSPGWDPHGSPPGSSFQGSPTNGLQLFSPESPDGSPTAAPASHNSTLGYLGLMRKRRADKLEKVKKTEQAKAEALAKKALLMLRQRSLARGWVSWMSWHADRSAKLQKLEKIASVLMDDGAGSARELKHGWRTWVSKHRELLHAAHLTQIADARVGSIMLRRGWRDWAALWRHARSQPKPEEVELVQAESQPTAPQPVLPIATSPRLSTSSPPPAPAPSERPELPQAREQSEPPGPPDLPPEPPRLPEQMAAVGEDNTSSIRLPDALVKLLAPFAAWLPQN